MSSERHESHEHLVTAVARAVVEGQTYPHFPSGLDLAAGEALQMDLATALGGVGGVKAGIGESHVQQFLGLDGPLLGFLYGDRRLGDGATLVADEAVRVECELGVVLDVSGTITAACPVVEIVRPDFADSGDMTAANLAACNVAADRCIVGPVRPWAGPIGGRVIARRDGETIVDAGLDDSLGGPVAAVEWMVTETERRGIERWDDMLFITGTCGQAAPLLAGRYEVDFGALGIVRFTAS